MLKVKGELIFLLDSTEKTCKLIGPTKGFFMANKKKVVLVYSGGLDTTVCIPLMKEEYGYDEVITVTVDVGQEREDIQQAEEKAKVMKTTHFTVDARAEFAEKFCFKAIKANGYYQDYPLSTSIARPIISQKAVEIAQKVGATAFAHGCTGKGNDQFRIEYMIRAMMPNAVIHAPIRERNMTRVWEIEYAQARGLPIKQSLEKIWSIDENIWGRSIEGGKLEDPNFTPPEEIFQWTKGFAHSLNEVVEVSIQFDKGSPTAINGKALAPEILIAQANKIAGDSGVGRIDIMEDRMLGLKVRENYECPGATLLLSAHKALESLVLTREERRFKVLIDQEWAKLAYEGLWLDPLKDDLEAFIQSTQERVTGEVVLRLFKGNCQVTRRSSSWALYSEAMASFDNAEAYDQRDSTGTVKQFGLQSRMYLQLKQNR
jgi:argininosuccinate synthase